MSMILYKKNDQFIELPNLRSALNDSDKKTTATVSGVLYDRDGQIVAGANGIVMSHVGSGTYRGRIDSSFDPPKGGGYRLKIDAMQDGDDFHEEVLVEVRVNEIR